tara:strand:- start:127 stop:408 length:282 start_codon:yes stop_codon:yes gene_type:complete
MTLKLSIELTETQEKGLSYITNLFNKGQSVEDKISVDEQANRVLVSFLNECADKRSSARTQYGLSLYTNAEPAVKEAVDAELGFDSEYPTGNE